LGVDIANRVKLVIATHWHDDHIHGLSEVLEESKSGKFVNSAADFQDLIVLVNAANRTASKNSATTEFGKIIDILKRRGRGCRRRALANKKLLHLLPTQRSVDIEAEVFALSPSDETFEIAREEIRYALDAVKSGRRPPNRTPNQISIALWVRVGGLDSVLGGDLEHSSLQFEGWNAVVFSNERPKGSPGFFKIPHHGSSNAHCPACWTDMLRKAPIAVLTPYAQSHLPKKRDVERLCSLTESVYLTSDPKAYRLPKREPAVERSVREAVGTNREALAGKMGHVRMRASARNLANPPVVTLSNGAARVCLQTEGI
jgi:hypothetical protein